MGEISAASREQSDGIDQVTIAISEMDKVTQQNAANAEESASASEEMNAQAAQMKSIVDQLVKIVGGGTGSNTESFAHSKSGPRLKRSVKKTQPRGKQLAKQREITPEQVIPFDGDDGFKDF